MRNKILFFLKLILLVAIFYWIFQSVDIQQTYQALTKTNPLLFIFAFVINNLSTIFLTIKWKRLSNPLKIKSNFFELLRLNYISVFYSSFLPGQASGEIIKGAKLTKKESAIQKVWVPIFIDKATNLLIIFLIGFVAILLDASYRKNTGLLLTVSGATFLLSLLTIILFSERTEKIVRFLREKAINILNVFRVKLEPLNKFSISYFEYYKKHDLLMLETLFWSILVKIPHIIVFYVLALSLNIQIDPVQAAWLFSMVSVVTLIPISFSGLGVREGTVIVILSNIGIDNASALSLSILIFILGILMALIGGLIELFNDFKK